MCRSKHLHHTYLPSLLIHAFHLPATLTHSFSGLSFTAGPGDHAVAVGGGTSSIRIPAGYSVIVYNSPHFGGKSQLLTKSVTCLRLLDDPDFENQVDSYSISSGDTLQPCMHTPAVCSFTFIPASVHVFF